MSGLDERLHTAEAPAAPRPRGRPPGSGSSRAAHVDERQTGEREFADRETTEDRGISEDERFELFRDSQFQSILPDLPKKPGYHVCWLTTSNPRDTIQRRLQMGYRLITIAEVPGWEEGVGLKSATHAGIIGVNEMVAAEIPERLYLRFMTEVHHTRPLSEEEKIRAMTHSLQEQAERIGARLQAAPGQEDVVQGAQLAANAFAED